MIRFIFWVISWLSDQPVGTDNPIFAGDQLRPRNAIANKAKAGCDTKCCVLRNFGCVLKYIPILMGESYDNPLALRVPYFQTNLFASPGYTNI